MTINNFIFFILLAFGVWLAIFIIRSLNRKRTEVQTLQSYAMRTEPIIEFSRFPGDNEVLSRVAMHEEMLLQSGNRFGRNGKPVPVFYYLYCSTDGKGGGLHTSFNQYIMDLGQFSRKVSQDWQDMISQSNHSAYLHGVMHQNEIK